jgi:hypothetical protein
METAGFRCAPEILPKARMSANRAAPVAIVFANNAKGDISVCKAFTHNPGADDSSDQKGGSDELSAASLG